MKHKSERGMFDEHFRLEKISKQNDPLIKLNSSIRWDQFQPILNEAFKKDRGVGGRPSYDYLLMFKILILQRYYNLSDDQCEYQILDRLSFMRFLGLRLSDRVPDSKTIWLFRQTLTENGAIEKLFERFIQSLDALGLIINEGKIVDASFVEAPKQRNSREENAQIKAGETPEGWSGNPHKIAQKDTDAKWTKKNSETHFGYKNHIKADQKSKLIENYVVTDASVHDSQAMADLLEDKDAGQGLYADSAYRSEEMEDILQFLEIISHIHEKGTRAEALSEEQQQNNRSKSKVRVRIEHIFGFVENSMNGSRLRSIGIKRAKGIIGLMNLTYNMFRSIQIISSQGITVAI